MDEHVMSVLKNDPDLIAGCCRANANNRAMAAIIIIILEYRQSNTGGLAPQIQHIKKTAYQKELGGKELIDRVLESLVQRNDLELSHPHGGYALSERLNNSLEEEVNKKLSRGHGTNYPNRPEDTKRNIDQPSIGLGNSKMN